MKVESNTLAAILIGALGAVLVGTSLTGLAISYSVCHLRHYGYGQIHSLDEQLVIWSTYLPWFCALGIGHAATAYFLGRGSRLARTPALVNCIATYVLVMCLLYSYYSSSAYLSFPFSESTQNILRAVHAAIVVIFATVFLAFVGLLLKGDGGNKRKSHKL